MQTGSLREAMPGSGAAGAAAAAYKDKHEQVLRIAASDVAAVAGYHEWVDVRDLFLERLLYQDLDHLLRLDAANVGIEVEDRRQRSERLLAKAGNGELRAVRRRAGDGAAVQTVQDAQALRSKARSLLKDAEGKNKLSKAEAKELESDLSHDINTQFGTRNENFALSVYERRSGTEVICSNERIMVWPFVGSKISGDGVPEGAMDPPTELSKGWTKKESRAGAERTPSAAEETAFASAVARCLAQLPALAAPERVGSGEAIPASSSSGSTDSGGDGCSGQASSSTKEGADGALGPQPREGAGGGDIEMMDVDAPTSEVAGEKGVARVGGGAADTGEKRELVPGVAWPEWRAPPALTTAACLGVKGALPAPPAEPSRLSETAPPVPPGGGLVASAAETANGKGGERGGLWFPASLTPRQRAAVTTAAEELGLCHGSFAGEAGGVRVVVWEPAAAAVPSPSQKRPSVCLPPGVPGGAVAVPSGGSNTRRSSSLLLRQAGVTDLEPDRGLATSGHDSAGASGDALAVGRRGSMAVTRTAAGTVVLAPRSGIAAPATATATAAAAEAGDGKSASGSSSVSGGETATTAFEESASSSANGSRSANGGGDDRDAAAAAAAAAPPPAIAKARLRNTDQFGADPVYAWGEGPLAAATAAPSEASEAPSEDAQEWSVWSRDPLTTNTGGGEKPSSRRGGVEVDGKERAETSSERRKNACFVVVGAVDGVAEEVTDASEDAETWETRRVVVEVKNRMNKARHPPPLYDQIQLVTYMLMIGAPVGDLVQFVKTGPASRRRGGGNGKRAPPADDVLVSRVELDCRTYHHKRHWEETILPRLYAFARMVYRFRGDDLLRWRYLLAAPSEQREMLVECCPYLDDVIRRTTAAQDPPPPPPPLTASGPEARLVPEVVVLDQATEGVAQTPAALQGDENGGTGTGSGAAAPNGVQDGAARTGEDQDIEGVGSSGSGGGSTVTVLCQKSRRGEPFVEPLGGVEVAATAASVERSPARKKAKVGVGVAVEQHDLAV